MNLLLLLLLFGCWFWLWIKSRGTSSHRRSSKRRRWSRGREREREQRQRERKKWWEHVKIKQDIRQTSDRDENLHNYCKMANRKAFFIMKEKRRMMNKPLITPASFRRRNVKRQKHLEHSRCYRHDNSPWICWSWELTEGLVLTELMAAAVFVPSSDVRLKKLCCKA